jgi:glycosyltransferase involved in cell wall biosynthesis
MLCEKLTWLLNDPHLHLRMSRAAAQYAHSYSWDKIAKQIVEVYKNVVRVKA